MFVATRDGFVNHLVHTRAFLADQGWIEHRLRTAEHLAAQCEGLAVGEFVHLLALGTTPLVFVVSESKSRAT